MCIGTVYILLYTLYVYREVSIGGVCIGGVWGVCVYICTITKKPKFW